MASFPNRWKNTDVITMGFLGTQTGWVWVEELLESADERVGDSKQYSLLRSLALKEGREMGHHRRDTGSGWDLSLSLRRRSGVVLVTPWQHTVPTWHHRLGISWQHSGLCCMLSYRLLQVRTRQEGSPASWSCQEGLAAEGARQLRL